MYSSVNYLYQYDIDNTDVTAFERNYLTPVLLTGESN